MDALDSENLPPTLFAGYFDRNSPLSLWNKLGKEWSNRLLAALSSLPEAATMLHDETMLKRWLKKEHLYIPTPTDNRYRHQFWLEYEHSIDQERMMLIKNVYAFIGQEAMFYQLICADPNRMVWLMCRPAGYEANAREMLAFSTGRLREYLEKDPFEDPRKPNMKLLEIQVKIHQIFDLRLHGAPTQKIQQLNLNATLGAAGNLKELTDKGDMKGLQKKLEDLRARKRKAEGRGAQPALAEGESSVIDAEIVGAKDGKEAHGNETGAGANSLRASGEGEVPEKETVLRRGERQ